LICLPPPPPGGFGAPNAGMGFPFVFQQFCFVPALGKSGGSGFGGTNMQPIFFGGLVTVTLPMFFVSLLMRVCW
jgi:hypothetical protein